VHIRQNFIAHDDEKDGERLSEIVRKAKKDAEWVVNKVQAFHKSNKSNLPTRLCSRKELLLSFSYKIEKRTAVTVTLVCTPTLCELREKSCEAGGSGGSGGSATVGVWSNIVPIQLKVFLACSMRRHQRRSEHED